MRPQPLVVQSRPRYQRSVPSPFARQRGGSFLSMVRALPGGNWLLRQAKKRRAQRGGWLSASVPKPPGYDLTKWLLARQRRGQRGGTYSRMIEEFPRPYETPFMRRIKRRRR